LAWPVFYFIGLHFVPEVRGRSLYGCTSKTKA